MNIQKKIEPKKKCKKKKKFQNFYKTEKQNKKKSRKKKQKMDKPQKYITENGVMKLNPAYTKEVGTSVAKPKEALGVVSSMDDVMNINSSKEKNQAPLKLSESTNSSIEILQDKDFVDKLKSPKDLYGGDVVDALGCIV